MMILLGNLIIILFEIIQIIGSVIVEMFWNQNDCVMLFVFLLFTVRFHRSVVRIGIFGL